MLSQQSNVSKKELRKELINSRKKLDSKKIRDDKIINNLIDNPLFKNANQILCFVSLDDEIYTDDFINYSLKIGKKVAVPKCENEAGIMNFYYINSLDDLEIGSFNVREPKDNNNKIVTNYNDALIIVPGLAFDKEKNRIGYGKGYYDRFLKNNSLNSVGLCYNKFVLNTIPTDEYDVKVDIVITESEIIK